MRPQRGLDLCEETLGPDDRSELWLQKLESNLPLVPAIVGEVDRRYPTLTELALDAMRAIGD